MNAANSPGPSSPLHAAPPALSRAARLRRLWRRWPIAAAVFGTVAAIALGFLVGEKRGTAERAKVVADIESYRGVLISARAGRESRPQLDARIQSFANQTLGSTLETVDSEIRSRLNRACEEVGLTGFSVSTGTATVRSTPAKSEFRSTEQRRLREEPDFVEVQSTLVASGRVDRVLNLLQRVEAKPWLKRIESLRLDPSGDGSTVQMTLRMANLFLPGRSPKEPLAARPEALASSEVYGALLGSNLFRLATILDRGGNRATARGGQGQQTVAEPAALAAPDSPFPYAEWQITGIVEGPSGPEVWLRHLLNGTQLTLTPGGAVGELLLRGVEYDAALFDGFGSKFRIEVGNNLAQRGS